MWTKKRPKRVKLAKIHTLVGKSTEVLGDIEFSGGLHVDGHIRGSVTAPDDSGSVLTVSESGVIDGEVRVPHAVLNGMVVGDVHACQHVELKHQARVTGNVYYGVIELARGAEVNGNLVHDTGEPGHPLLPHADTPTAVEPGNKS